MEMWNSMFSRMYMLVFIKCQQGIINNKCCCEFESYSMHVLLVFSIFSKDCVSILTYDEYNYRSKPQLSIICLFKLKSICNKMSQILLRSFCVITYQNNPLRFKYKYLLGNGVTCELAIIALCFEGPSGSFDIQSLLGPYVDKHWSGFL